MPLRAKPAHGCPTNQRGQREWGTLSRVTDTYDLQRFVEAQQGLLDQVELELTTGRKRTHWMWFIFPQLVGLGRSAMAQRYALRSLEEARAYAAHASLGPRLRRHTALVMRHRVPLRNIFGSPDDLKFRSSMTLFGAALPHEALFQQALAHFGLEPDTATLDLLR